MVNGCAAHSSRRVLTRHLKTCSLITLFTNNIAVTARKSERVGVDAPLLLDAPPLFPHGRSGFCCHLLSQFYLRHNWLLWPL
jgi:hypothetical protein